MQTSVLIPAHNESERIAATIAALRALPSDCRIGEIIVVDDGSTDDTAAKAEAAGADVIFRQPNRGKGAALQQAFGLSQGDVLLLADADLGDSAAEAEKLLRPVLSGAADMTIATFPIIPGKGGGAGLVVKLARWGIRRLTGRTMTAPLSGQRAVRREVITACGGFASGWGVEIALTVTSLRNDFRVLEISTNMTHRVTGRSPAAIRHRAAQFFAAVGVLFRLRREQKAAVENGRRPRKEMGE
jgi:glycosyltransferase involved in cell wall biosynthesis